MHYFIFVTFMDPRDQSSLVSFFGLADYIDYGSLDSKKNLDKYGWDLLLIYIGGNEEAKSWLS